MSNLKSFLSSSWAVFLLLAIIGFLLYSHVILGDFQFDDMDYIVDDPSIKELTNIKQIWGYKSHYIRFFSFLSFALNYHFHGLQVEGYHIINIIIHIMNALLIWHFVRLTLLSPSIKRRWSDLPAKELALCSALLFLVHPLQTQAVSYITQRFASFATFFYLSSLCCYAQARLSDRWKKLFYSLCFLSALCGMFTKQIVFTLPIVIFLYDRYFFHVDSKKNKYIGTYAVMVGMLLVIPFLYRFDLNNLISQNMISHSHAQSGEMITSGKYLLTQFRVIVKYIQLFIFPISQNLDYDYTLSRSLFEFKTFISFIFLISLFIFGILIRRKNIILSFCIVYFFIALSVESSIIPIPHVIFEHRMYLPGIGFCFAVPFLLQFLIKDRQKWRITLCIVLMAFSFMTYTRNFVWQTPFTLWSDVAKKSPNKARAYNNLALSYMLENRVEEAYEQFQLALQKNPHYSKAHSGIGNIYRSQGRLSEALLHYDYAVRSSPKSAKYRNNRAVILKAQGKYQEAFSEFNEALRLDPYSIEALNNMGNLYRAQRNYRSALELYNRAIARSPNFLETYNNRGLLYKYQKEYGLALNDYNKILSLNGNHVAALNNRGLIHKEQKKYGKALKDFNAALKLDANQPKLFNNRGFVYEKQNMFDRALKDYNQAIKLDPNFTLAFSNRGFVYLQKGQLERAMTDLNTALSIGGEEGKSYYHRSLAYYALENYSQALEDLNQAQIYGFNPPRAYIASLQAKTMQ